VNSIVPAVPKSTLIRSQAIGVACPLSSPSATPGGTGSVADQKFPPASADVQPPSLISTATDWVRPASN